MEAVQTFAGQIGSSTQPASIPLSQDIIQRTTNHLQMAHEISSRLWSLRDRLLGSPAETNGKDMARPEHSHFAGAYGDKALDLTDALNTIDRLSSELSSRL